MLVDLGGCGGWTMIGGATNSTGGRSADAMVGSFFIFLGWGLRFYFMNGEREIKRE